MGSLKNGTPMQDRKLAEELGFSRTPVREALHRLEGEGLLERRHRLLFVASISVQDVLEIFQVRQILEAQAARNACGRMSASAIAEIQVQVSTMSSPVAVSDDAHWAADDLVHLSIARACGNSLMLRLVSELRRKTRLFGLYRIPSRFEAGRTEHLAILDALAAQNSDRAAELMAAHIANARKAVLVALENGCA
jgi:DNA-binding GntR family transcriptional regulator